MRNWKKVLSVTAAAAVAATAAMPTAVFAEGDETFKIGVIGPMTGDYAQYGTNVYNAAKIAVDEINEDGGFNGYQVEVLDAGDDMGDPEKAVNAYNDLLDKGMQMLWSNYFRFLYCSRSRGGREHIPVYTVCNSR